MNFILPLPLDRFQIRFHGIVTDGEQIYSFVPHSHAILHFFLCLWTFVPLWVLLFAFFLNFNSRSFIHSVLLCERYFNFNSRTEKNFGNLIHTDVVQYVFWYLSIFRRFWLSITFWLSIHGMRLFKYNTTHTLLPFHGSFAITP